MQLLNEKRKNQFALDKGFGNIKYACKFFNSIFLIHYFLIANHLCLANVSPTNKLNIEIELGQRRRNSMNIAKSQRKSSQRHSHHKHKPSRDKLTESFEKRYFLYSSIGKNKHVTNSISLLDTERNMQNNISLKFDKSKNANHPQKASNFLS